MMLSKMVRVRMRVINQSNKNAGNDSGMHAVLGCTVDPSRDSIQLCSCFVLK